MSMTSLGSSPGGEVFYVSSEESRAHLPKYSAGFRFGILPVRQEQSLGWLPKWPADFKRLSLHRPQPNSFSMLVKSKRGLAMIAGLHNQRAVPGGQAAIPDHSRP